MEQNLNECSWLLHLIRKSRSVLEIGSRRGGFLEMLAHACQPGSKVCSIDLGRDIEGAISEPYGHELQQTIARLRTEGYDAECLIADSTTKEAIAWAKERAPFDFIFIDGDHSFEGVKSDWLNYGGFSDLVGFHDIFNPHLGVERLWAEISQNCNTVVIRQAQSPMGIGVAFKVIPKID